MPGLCVPVSCAGGARVLPRGQQGCAPHRARGGQPRSSGGSSTAECASSFADAAGSRCAAQRGGPGQSRLPLAHILPDGDLCACAQVLRPLWCTLSRSQGASASLPRAPAPCPRCRGQTTSHSSCTPVAPRGGPRCEALLPTHALLLNPQAATSVSARLPLQPARSAVCPLASASQCHQRHCRRDTSVQGVPLSHGNLCASITNIIQTYEMVATDVSYLVMPLFHVHGLMAGEDKDTDTHTHTHTPAHTVHTCAHDPRLEEWRSTQRQASIGCVCCVSYRSVGPPGCTWCGRAASCGPLHRTLVLD